MPRAARRVLAALLAAHTLPVTAGPGEDALAVVDRWRAAYAAADVDAMVALYAPDAASFGTGSRTLVTDPDALRAYFRFGLVDRQARSAEFGPHEVRVLSDDAVVVTGLDTLHAATEPTTMHGRVTFVVARGADGWRIVHFHRSVVPP